MADLEKTINALGRCESYGYCEDKQCPYYECVGCLELLRKDALSILEAQAQEIAELKLKIHELQTAQEPRVMTLEEVRQMGQRNIHHGKAPVKHAFMREGAASDWRPAPHSGMNPSLKGINHIWISNTSSWEPMNTMLYL